MSPPILRAIKCDFVGEAGYRGQLVNPPAGELNLASAYVVAAENLRIAKTSRRIDVPHLSIGGSGHPCPEPR